MTPGPGGPDNYTSSDYACTLDAFAEHFQALDEWLTRGGFAPTDWEKSTHITINPNSCVRCRKNDARYISAMCALCDMKTGPTKLMREATKEEVHAAIVALMAFNEAEV